MQRWQYDFQSLHRCGERMNWLAGMRTMKTILLIRHSEAIKDRTMPTGELPLSDQGHRKAQELFALDVFRSVKAVYTSPYRRAYTTAEKLNRSFMVDDRLRERDLGNPETLNAAFWNRQYMDYDYKNENGESMNDTRKRMSLAVHEIISMMKDGDTIAIVSHAAAICAFLLNWCSIEVMDEQKKVRKITHNGSVVLSGKIATPSAFILAFEDEHLCGIRYTDKEDPLS